MHVTLHLGAHRTGMGGLLGALMANAAPLQRSNIAVWNPDDLRGGMGGGLVRRNGRVSIAQEKQYRRASGRLQLRQNQLERDGFERLLVLGPDFLGQPSDSLGREVMYPDAMERMLRSAPAFVDRCDRVTLSIRRADRWWSSALATSVALGRWLPQPEELAALSRHPRQWRHIIREVAKVFPKAELIVWPSEVLMDLPERQIAAMTGDPDDPLLVPYRGRLERAPDATRLERSLAKRGTPAVLPRDETGRWAPFTPQEVDAFAAQYQEDLAWLRAGAGGLATAIGLDGADVAPKSFDMATQQQGADHDPPHSSRRLG